jgi:hypothetical protein
MKAGKRGGGGFTAHASAFPGRNPQGDAAEAGSMEVEQNEWMTKRLD